MRSLAVIVVSILALSMASLVLAGAVWVWQQVL